MRVDLHCRLGADDRRGLSQAVEEAEACSSVKGHFEGLQSHATVSLEPTYLRIFELLTFRLETQYQGCLVLLV